MDTQLSVITFLFGLLFYRTTEVDGHEKKKHQSFQHTTGLDISNLSILILKKTIPWWFCCSTLLMPVALLLRSWPLLVRSHFGSYFPLLGSWLTFWILFPVPACFSMPGRPVECETVGLWTTGFVLMYWKGRTVGYWIAAMNEAPFSAFISRKT